MAGVVLVVGPVGSMDGRANVVSCAGCRVVCNVLAKSMGRVGHVLDDGQRTGIFVVLSDATISL